MKLDRLLVLISLAPCLFLPLVEPLLVYYAVRLIRHTCSILEYGSSDKERERRVSVF